MKRFRRWPRLIGEPDDMTVDEFMAGIWAAGAVVLGIVLGYEAGGWLFG